MSQWIPVSVYTNAGTNYGNFNYPVPGSALPPSSTNSVQPTDSRPLTFTNPANIFGGDGSHLTGVGGGGMSAASTNWVKTNFAPIVTNQYLGTIGGGTTTINFANGLAAVATYTSNFTLAFSPWGNTNQTQAAILEIMAATNLGFCTISGGQTTNTIAGYTVNTFTNSGALMVSGTGTVTMLIVAGGGGGGSTLGGGGGGGGVIYTNVLMSGSNTVTVGAGGLGGTNTSSSTDQGATGVNSSVSSYVAIGGGGAGAGWTHPNGLPGGSGGGGGGGLANTYGTNTPGQGYNGGTGSVASTYGGGGGGGGGSNGTNGAPTFAGMGGDGFLCPLNSTYYGGGGGAGVQTSGGSPSGSGGIGGGGAGTNSLVKAKSGTPNTGGGGGGGGYTGGPSIGIGGDGGSGIVIVFAPPVGSVTFSGILKGTLSPSLTQVAGALDWLFFYSMGTNWVFKDQLSNVK